MSSIFTDVLANTTANLLADLFTAAQLKNLDRIVKAHACFASFEDLVDAKGGYRPTLRIDESDELCELAVAYDAFQASRGDTRRAFVPGGRDALDTLHPVKAFKARCEAKVSADWAAQRALTLALAILSGKSDDDLAKLRRLSERHGDGVYVRDSAAKAISRAVACYRTTGGEGQTAAYVVVGAQGGANIIYVRRLSPNYARRVGHHTTVIRNSF
jgi:hypothetical protein